MKILMGLLFGLTMSKACLAQYETRFTCEGQCISVRDSFLDWGFSVMGESYYSKTEALIDLNRKCPRFMVVIKSGYYHRELSYSSYSLVRYGRRSLSIQWIDSSSVDLEFPTTKDCQNFGPHQDINPNGARSYAGNSRIQG